MRTPGDGAGMNSLAAELRGRALYMPGSTDKIRLEAAASELERLTTAVEHLDLGQRALAEYSKKLEAQVVTLRAALEAVRDTLLGDGEESPNTYELGCALKIARQALTEGSGQ